MGLQHNHLEKNFAGSWLLTVLVAVTISTMSVAKGNPFDVDLSILDKKTQPCDDFYRYACGGWLDKAEIPSDRPMWSRSFSTIDLNNQKILKKILDNLASGQKKTSTPYAKTLGEFYASCMDEKYVEKNSLSEVRLLLAEADKVKSVSELSQLLAQLHRQDVGAFFGFGSEQDAKDSTQVIGVVDQGGLGLPDRDYYLKDDAKMVQIRAQYKEHIEKMFHLLGIVDKDAQSASLAVLKIETALAKASLSRVERRDPNNVYHRINRKGLMSKAPLFGWNEYFNHLDKSTTPQLEAINVAVPSFFEGLNQVLKDTSLPDLKTYLKWHMLAAFTPAMPARFVDERFRFTSTALSGQKSLEVRWKRCVKATNAKLGFALGRAFVEVAYGKEGKEKSKKMVAEIEADLKRGIESLEWMDAVTKKAALLKLEKTVNKIGFPDVWRSYDGLKLGSKSYLSNLLAGAEFNSYYELRKIGKPVDPNEWLMTPSMVNAYYDPQKNEIVFPAGILQYPFFNKKSPDSLNYGAIGVVIGHELTHGFDDQGRRYDADGNLKDWWNEKDLKQFEAKTACVVKEYNQFEVLPGVFVNGQLTLGENIADQGGMKFAYRAWKAKETANQVSTPAPQPTVTPGKLSQDQRFFIAFAQSWCQKEHEQFTRMRVTVDPHSPSRYRVNGVLSQFKPFAEVFACQSGSPMAPQDRCEVW